MSNLTSVKGMIRKHRNLKDDKVLRGAKQFILEGEPLYVGG